MLSSHGPNIPFLLPTSDILNPGSIKYKPIYIISGFHIYCIIGYDFDGKLTTCNESDSERLTSCRWPTVTAAAVSWL